MGHLNYYFTFVGIFLVIPIEGRSFLYQIDDSVEQNLVEHPTYITDRKIPIRSHHSKHPSLISVKLQGDNHLAQGDMLSSTEDRGIPKEQHVSHRKKGIAGKKVEKPPTQIKEESLVLPYKINKNKNARDKESKKHYHNTYTQKQDMLKEGPRVLLHTKHKILSRPKEQVYLRSKVRESNAPVQVHIKAAGDNKGIATMNDQSLGNNEIETAAVEENINTPALDIPEKYLKIPDSDDKLKSLVGGIKRRHPCVSQFISGNMTDRNHFREQKYLRLCRNNGNRNLRHKHRSDKSKHQSDTHKNGETKIGEKMNENVSPPPTVVMLNRAGSGKETSISHSQDYFSSVSLEEKEKGDNVISISETDKVSQKDILKSSTENVKTTSISPPQFNNLKNTSNNISSLLREMTNGHDVISKCSLSQNDDNSNDIFKPENLKRLIDEVGDNAECWQTGALKGVYHLEQRYKHAKDKSQLPQEDIEGIDHIICYLIKELQHCNLKGLSDKQTDTKVSTTTKMPVTTKATTAKPNRQQNFETGFDLDWEANLLFY